MYGREPGFEDKAGSGQEDGQQEGKRTTSCARRFQQEGDKEAIEQARRCWKDMPASPSTQDRERLFGYLEGTGKMILVEPGYAHLPRRRRCRGWTGRRCPSRTTTRSPCVGAEESVARRSGACRPIPIAVRRTDPGDPDKCPVWQLHQVYSGDEVKAGCRKAVAGGNRLRRMQAAGDRQHSERAGADA
jgi:tryptophanyl-tRNA synthetase